jgi:SRSO17 transposase
LEISRPDGVLVIEETADRKDGHDTAHVGRQYLANLGKIDNVVVSVTNLWADEHVYYPVDFEPYTQTHHFLKGPQTLARMVASPGSRTDRGMEEP